MRVDQVPRCPARDRIVHRNETSRFLIVLFGEFWQTAVKRRDSGSRESRDHLTVHERKIRFP